MAAGFGGPEVPRNIEADVPDPGPGQVTISVRACGMNPADAKHIAPGQDPGLLPLSIGYEVAGAAGAVGMSVLQQARLLGVRVVGTASPPNFGVVRRFGGIPVAYGPGLLDRVRATAPEGIAAALDTAGSPEASDTSLALVADRRRVVTIAAAPRAKADGYVFIGATNPASGPFRARVRSRILKLAQDGDLVVPMAVNCVLGGATIALLFDLAFKVPLPAAAGIGVAAGLALLALSLRYEHRRLTPVVLSSYVATAMSGSSPGVT